MLGKSISDPFSAEEGGNMRGMELLAIDTVLKKDKIRTQVTGRFCNLGGELSALSGMEIEGYEIHMGVSSREAEASVLSVLTDKKDDADKADGAFLTNVYGTYVHGIFDHGEIAPAIVKCLAEKKGIAYDGGQPMDHKIFRETQYDKLAKVLREYLDMDYIYDLLEVEHKRVNW